MLTAERAARFAALAIAVLVLAFVLPPSSATAAPRDRTPPTTPTNLRVTALTSYTVSLAWNPSTDNSGMFTYRICCANVSSQWVSPPATSVTYTAGLEANRSFTLRIYAVDAAGNYSSGSNAVTFTTPKDTTPPTTPAVSLTDVGPTHVSLLWSSIEDGPYVWFTVFKDGIAILNGTRDTSAIIPLLEPQTPYAFTVRAKDFAANFSPMSAPVVATTEAPNPDDITAPTTPGNFSGSPQGCEMWMQWNESTDDLDPQWIIEYEVYVNDVYDHSTSLRYTSTITYANRDGVNTFSVVAVDTAGNRSAPAEISDTFDGCAF